jgi:hypothetical protein
MDRGIFATPIRNDYADAPYILQSPDTATTVVSNYFIMAEGGISATTSEGLTTGASNEVPNESGLLSFALATDTLLPTPAQRVYCVLVRTESLDSCDWS